MEALDIIKIAANALNEKKAKELLEQKMKQGNAGKK